MEVWKDIDGYEGKYQVSNLGRVKSLERIIKCGDSKYERIIMEAIKKNRDDGKGYMITNLYDNKTDCRRVHRLVATAFIPNPENKPEVNHVNGIKDDNKAENLEWCTAKENIRHAYDTGLKRRGEEHVSAKISEAEVFMIRQLLNERKYTKLYVSRIFGVSAHTIQDIHRKRTWKHLG